MNQSGFFRVSIAKRKNNKYFKYQIRNELIHKEIIKKDIYELKQIVEEYGFLWGIIDLKKAKDNKQKYNLKALQGRYGKQIGDKNDV